MVALTIEEAAARRPKPAHAAAAARTPKPAHTPAAARAPKPAHTAPAATARRRVITRRRVTRRRAIGVRSLRVLDDPLPRVRSDTLPEDVAYRDTGCDLYASCLRCPLAQCQFDVPKRARSRVRLDARDREIALLRERHGAPIAMLAQYYGITRRTVFHILARQRTLPAPAPINQPHTPAPTRVTEEPKY